MTGISVSTRAVSKHALVEIGNSAITGKGLFAVAPIHEGEIVIKWQPLRRLCASELSSCSIEERHYISRADDGQFLLMGEPERFVNHSCSPNTRVQGESDVALREINVGEEITSDYGPDEITAFPCRCGSSNCRGWIGPAKITLE